MPRIELVTTIHAPPALVFDLARDVDAHVASAEGTSERAVGGKTSGLLGAGDEVTWEARHLGVTQRLTSRIVAFEAPTYFRDAMVAGAFARFDHDHWFLPCEEGCLARDVFDYTSPLGPLGRIADALFLERYMRRFLETRMRILKEMAERAAAGAEGDVGPRR